jgi:hypothetical protein
VKLKTGKWPHFEHLNTAVGRVFITSVLIIEEHGKEIKTLTYKNEYLMVRVPQQH